MLKITKVVLLLALVYALSYLFLELREAQSEINRLNNELEYLLAENTKGMTQVSSNAPCASQFSSGLYQLTTATPYGPGSDEEYDIDHVSMRLGEWNLNAGIASGSYRIPIGFYLDYDGDGKVDTAIAVRLAREIPLIGNTLADKLLGDSSTHENLYSIFSCEWQSAEFISSDDMASEASGTTTMLWDLVQEYSETIEEWIATSMEDGVEQ